MPCEMVVADFIFFLSSRTALGVACLVLVLVLVLVLHSFKACALPEKFYAAC